MSMHDNLRQACGIGVAGNFAGHLEQAGEAVDFVHVDAAAALPKGIFPWYMPSAPSFLGAYPLSSDTLAIPRVAADAQPTIQIEPEVGVMCDITYSSSGTITKLSPRWIAAFDDCSIRRPGAAKISEKKNWGAASKGVAATTIAVTDLDPHGMLASWRLACFLTRNGETHTYGVDSAIPTYSLFGEDLLDWCVERLAHQREAPNTPLEDVGSLIRTSRASSVLIGVGATRYEPFGESTFVQLGDDAIVVIYDADTHDPATVADLIAHRRDAELTAASVLRRVAKRGPSE